MKYDCSVFATVRRRVLTGSLALFFGLSPASRAFASFPTPSPANTPLAPTATSSPNAASAPAADPMMTPLPIVASPSAAGGHIPAASDTASPSSSTPASDSSSVLVPGGTTVLVSLAEPLSSATAKVDDQIAIVVQKDVIVDGRIVIAKGGNGHATVASSEGAGSNGSGGKLALNVDWVYSVDGGKVKLSSTAHNAEESDSKGAASTATLLSWALLGPLGFFAHNFVRGRQATIGTDKKFVVFVDKDVHVNAGAGAAQDQGFDH